MRTLVLLITAVATLANAQAPERALPAKREVPLDLSLAGDVARKPAEPVAPKLTPGDLWPSASQRQAIEALRDLVRWT